jgi:hypothetical protein
MIKIYPILFILSFLILIIGGCKGIVLESHWVAQPVSIDSSDADWEAAPLQMLESLSASIGAQNDADYLYLFFRVENPVTAEILRSAGISLAFTGPNEKEPLSIHYSGVDTLRPGFDSNDSFWECMTDAQKARFRKQQSEQRSMMTVVQNEKTIRIPSDGSEGSAAAAVSKRGSYGYEFRIPIQGSENRPHAIRCGLGETMEVRIIPGGGRSDEKETLGSQGYPLSTEDMGRMGGRGGRGFGPMQGNREIRFMLILAEAS